MASLPAPKRLSVSFTSLPKPSGRATRATNLPRAPGSLSQPLDTEMAPGTLPGLSDRPLSAIGKIKVRDSRPPPPPPFRRHAVTWSHAPARITQRPRP